MHQILTPNFGADQSVDPTEWLEEPVGELAIDVYQTPMEIVIKAPIAGVRQEDLDVTITDDLVTISGERHDRNIDSVEGYMVQECYWGAFSRTYNLPVSVNTDKSTAKLVDGILTITIPKTEQSRTKTISVEVG